jgi:hypothetical protein
VKFTKYSQFYVVSEGQIVRSATVIHSFIHSFINGSTALLGHGRIFSFVIQHTFGRTPLTGDQQVARPLPAHRTAQTQNKCTQICLEWYSKPRSQCSSERRRFMPFTARPLLYLIKFLVKDACRLIGGQLGNDRCDLLPIED